jgi:hypothetical protein
MTPTDAERFEKLAKAYSTNADYCRHTAEKLGNRSSKEHWVRLAASWMRLAAEAKAKSRSTRPSVTQREVALSCRHRQWRVRQARDGKWSRFGRADKEPGGGQLRAPY